MNNVAIAFSTKDRVELSRQSIVPLLQPDKFDLIWSDGSQTEAGRELLHEYWKEHGHAKWTHLQRYSNVTGGADAAIAFNLTTMLRHPNRYDYVGLVENDVLLDPDWFEQTMLLFSKGEEDGLHVGAVSARCYEDRILLQRDGYAVMHNLGAGMTIFSREAAELVLQNFRTGWTLENRRTFAQLAGNDIGGYWAFGGNAHMTCADWQFDRTLAQHGLASLALTPAKCQMIGQVPPLAEQGLTLAIGLVEARRDDYAFELYRQRTAAIRDNDWIVPNDLFLNSDDGSVTIFPHQLALIGGLYQGDWKLKWAQGFGPFAWCAEWDGVSNVGRLFSENIPRVTIPVSGPCVFLVSGGKTGGKVQITDDQSGYDIALDLAPEGAQGQVMQAQVPAAISYRNVRLTALTPGVVFYGIVCREQQPLVCGKTFDHSWLPSP